MRNALVLTMVAVACALPIFFSNDYYGGILNTAATYAIVAVGLNLLSGGTGQFSLGHAGFYAMGAFSAGLLSVNAGWPFWLDVPAAGMVAASAGLIVGIPTLRLSGPYFSIATLGFGLLVVQVLNGADWAGGRSGVSLTSPQIAGFTFSEAQFFWVVLGVLCICTFVVHNLRHGTIGLALVAMRESEPAALASGINLARFKVGTFALSAMFAGIAGALFAHWSGYVSASSFGLPISILFVALIVVGGLDSVTGSLLGAVFLTGIQEKLQDNPQLAQTLYGAVIVIALLFVPGGLVRVPALLGRLYRSSDARTESSTHG
ncbi:MAG: inner-rane translocator [Chloroflexi bacterium]|nr:inner-rane translocator [Chloroflexota bacterium]